jgi:TM2 domain-containing membrane protein YozV
LNFLSLHLFDLVYRNGVNVLCKLCSEEAGSDNPVCEKCEKINSPAAMTIGEQLAALKQGKKIEEKDERLIYSAIPPLSPHHALFNALIPGVAQLIFGQTGKGIALLAASVICYSVELPFVSTLLFLGGLIDAYMVGSALKSTGAVGKWAFFPKTNSKKMSP